MSTHMPSPTFTGAARNLWILDFSENGDVGLPQRELPEVEVEVEEEEECGDEEEEKERLSIETVCISEWTLIATLYICKLSGSSRVLKRKRNSTTASHLACILCFSIYFCETNVLKLFYF